MLLYKDVTWWMPFDYNMSEQRSSSNVQRKQKYILKVILIGDSGVGKTSLARKFYTSRPQNDVSNDTGRHVYQLFERDVEINDDMATLRVMDTVGKNKEGSWGDII